MLIISIIIFIFLGVNFPRFTASIFLLFFYGTLAISSNLIWPFVILYIFSVVCLLKSYDKYQTEECEERETFEKQKTKVKLISGYSSSNVEKEVNKFIRDKHVLNVTFDNNRGYVTATILYEDL